MASSQFSWLCFNKNPEKRVILESILPSGYRYRVTSFKIIEESLILNENKFEAVVDVNVCEEEEIWPFLVNFENDTMTNYNVLHGDTKTAKKTKVSGYRKCHHNIRKRPKSGDTTPPPSKTAGKQTNCPAGINFKLKFC